MSNFGFRDLRLVQPFEASFREARSAVGASEILAAAREYASVAEAVGDCSLVVGTTSGARRHLQHDLKPLDQATVIIRRRSQKGRVAVLFGSEKRGLSNEDFSHCHWLMRIPTLEEHGSMNLGQAVAVCVYELSCPPRKGAAKAKPASLKPKHDKDWAAKQADVERITTLLLQLLSTSGYLEPESPVAASEEKVRRMVLRLELSAADAEIWLGMLRQILWKLNQPSKVS